MLRTCRVVVAPLLLLSSRVGWKSLFGSADPGESTRSHENGSGATRANPLRYCYGLTKGLTINIVSNKKQCWQMHLIFKLTLLFRSKNIIPYFPQEGNVAVVVLVDHAKIQKKSPRPRSGPQIKEVFEKRVRSCLARKKCGFESLLKSGTHGQKGTKYWTNQMSFKATISWISCPKIQVTISVCSINYHRLLLRMDHASGRFFLMMCGCVRTLTHTHNVQGWQFGCGRGWEIPRAIFSVPSDMPQ